MAVAKPVKRTKRTKPIAQTFESLARPIGVKRIAQANKTFSKSVSLTAKASAKLTHIGTPFAITRYLSLNIEYRKNTINSSLNIETIGIYRYFALNGYNSTGDGGHCPNRQTTVGVYVE